MRNRPVARVGPVRKHPFMTPTALAHSVTEHDPVRRWRLDLLVRAGYQPWDALVLSRRSDVDLHVALALLEKGCPVETALRILL